MCSMDSTSEAPENWPHLTVADHIWPHLTKVGTDQVKGSIAEPLAHRAQHHRLQRQYEAAPRGAARPRGVHEAWRLSAPGNEPHLTVADHRWPYQTASDQSRDRSSKGGRSRSLSPAVPSTTSSNLSPVPLPEAHHDLGERARLRHALRQWLREHGFTVAELARRVGERQVGIHRFANVAKNAPTERTSTG